MPRVCVIRCHYFRTTRLQRKVNAPLDRGHLVRVLCLSDESEPLRELRRRLSICRMPIRHRAGAGIAGRLVEYVTFFVLVGLGVAALHLRRRFDLVQVNSPPDVSIFAALVPRLAGARVLLYLHEPLPEFFATKLEVGDLHPVARLIAAFEQASIRFADAALTATEQMREALDARGASPNKIGEVIVDPLRISPHVWADDMFVVVCHGRIEPQYGPDTVILAVAQLAAAIPSLELRIIVDGSRRSELQALASRLGVCDRVVFSYGFIPIDELVATLPPRMSAWWR
jgi:glycosyltransferase involved in cell wall biosynthesis